jgi:superfamily II DNA or RNA helicase
LEGLFGSVKQVTTTAELMESKTVANLKIKSLVLSYEDEVRQLLAKGKTTYVDEIQYLTTNKARNKFIINLVSSLENNTLLLFNLIDHGKLLESSLREMNPDKDIFLVYGKVEGEEREEIRKYVENNANVIVVASYKTFSTGVNIQNLHNVVFGSPSKSRIRVLQSVGRGLRKNEFKLDATLYDIADDLSWKSYKNHTIKHFADRIQMYNQEKFDYKIYTIKLKGT